MPNKIQKIIEETNWNQDQRLGQFLSRKGVEQIIISLLSQEIYELEEMKEEVDLGKGSEFSTPRDYRNRGYNQALSDLITKKKQIISELEK